MTSIVKRLRLVPLSLLAIAAAGVGCVALVKPREWGTSPSSSYPGAECAQYLSDDPGHVGISKVSESEGRSTFEGQRLRSKTPFDGAMFVTCVDSTGRHNNSSNSNVDAIIADHLDFDDRHFDPLRAAVMVIDCALNENCSVTMERDVLGVVAGYAHRVELSAAETAFAAAGASPSLNQAFIAKLGWARDTIARRVAELGPRGRELWVGIPEQVWTERHGYFQRYEDLFKTLDPLLAIATSGSGDLPAAATKLRALRQKYLDACKVEGCLFTPFILETTRALALIAVRQREVPEALAEAALLRDDRLQSQLFSHAMAAALLLATEREAKLWEKYSAAKASGADQATLGAMFGNVPPIQVSGSAGWTTWGKKPPPDITAALSVDGVVTAGGNVRAVQRRGDRALVQFPDTVTTYSDEDCHETDRIDGIDSRGKIIYRQACTNYRSHTEHTKVEPIDVPAGEASGLQVGELVTAWVTKDGRRGAIIDVQHQDSLVQVRGHRLHVKEQRAVTRATSGTVR